MISATTCYDFTLHVASWFGFGIYHYDSRPDITDGYHPITTALPVKTRVLTIEECTHAEASATILVEAIDALTKSARGVCGYYRDSRHKPFWTLLVIVDSEELCKVLQREGEYSRVHAIVDRCWKDLSWFKFKAEWREITMDKMLGN